MAIYARVSTTEQTTENQLLDLRHFCAARGWRIVETFDDSGWSGAKKNRPNLDRLMAFVRARRCDCVLVWKYDRFARSSAHLVATLEEFRELGVDFASLRDSIDTTTAHGRLFFTFIAGIAEFEREIIRERIHAGLRRARDQGKRLGRLPLSKDKAEEIRSLRGTGSIRQIAARVGVSRSVVHKVLSLRGGQNVAQAVDGEVVA